MKIPSNIKATLKTDFKFSTTSNNHIYLIQCAVLDCIHYTFYVKYNNRLNADLSVIKYIHNSFLAKVTYMIHFWHCQITNWIHQDTFINQEKNVT